MRYIPFNQGIAYLIAILTWVVPVSVLGDNPDIFGSSASLILFLIAIVGGLASFVFWVDGTDYNLIAAISGVLAGVGAGTVIVYFSDVFFEHDKFHNRISILLLAISIAPGLVLFYILKRNKER
jgi:hypothetical protein